MKKILFIAFMLVPFLSFAQKEKQSLVIWQKNGQKIYYNLNEEPRTRFASGRLVITTNTLTTEYVLADILRYTYEGIHTGISTTDANSMGFIQKGDDVDIIGLEKGRNVQLYDTRGILLDNFVSDGTTPVHFSLTGLPAGIYIVKLNGQSLKFKKQ